MKTLGLLRHAKSGWDDSDTRDFDRGLNARGRQGAALIGAHIQRVGPAWDRVLASSAERVRQTLAAAMPDAAPEWEPRLYLADTTTIFEVLRAADDAEAVLVVGHNPGLQEMLLELVGNDTDAPSLADAARKYPTATYAQLELDIADWADLEKGCGALTDFTRPRDLDPALGPEN